MKATVAKEGLVDWRSSTYTILFLANIGGTMRSPDRPNFLVQPANLMWARSTFFWPQAEQKQPESFRERSRVIHKNPTADTAVVIQLVVGATSGVKFFSITRWHRDGQWICHRNRRGWQPFIFLSRRRYDT